MSCRCWSSLVMLLSLCGWAVPVRQALPEKRSIAKFLPKIGNWDEQSRRQLRKIIELDMLVSAKHLLADDVVEHLLADPDYIPEVTERLQQALERRALARVIDRPLLWRVHDPWGRQHQMLATIHNLSLESFSPTARSLLETAVEQAGVLLSENGSAGTESLDRQLNLLGVNKRLVALDNLPVSANIELQFDFADLVESLENLEIFHIAYTEGNWQKLTEMADKVYRDARFERIDQHNHQWLERIIDNCSESCFIFVGTIHLVLDNETTTSIIELLSQQGFEIEHIPDPRKLPNQAKRSVLRS